jgi:hypothetical protein
MRKRWLEPTDLKRCILQSSDGLMRVLSAIVGPQALPVDAAETKVATRTARGSQLVGHDQRGPYPVPLQEFLDQLRRDLGVSSSLDHKVQGLTLVVGCTPEPMLLASDEHGHLVEMPMITGFGRPRLRLAATDEPNSKT